MSRLQGSLKIVYARLKLMSQLIRGGHENLVSVAKYPRSSEDEYPKTSESRLHSDHPAIGLLDCILHN